MKAVIVFVDGIICDNRQRQPLTNTPNFFGNDAISKDLPTQGSLRCLQEIARKYTLVYLALRPEVARKATEDWLNNSHFPRSTLILGVNPAELLALTPKILEQFDAVYGIGLELAAKELPGALKCTNIPVNEFDVDWDLVRSHLLKFEYDALHSAMDLLTPCSLKTTEPEPFRVDIYIESGKLLTAVKTLNDAHWGFLTAITGLDDTISNEFEVLYHFANKLAIVTLRVRIPHEKAEIPSVCGIKPGATFFERELSEMFGIEVVGTPDPSRLFLPDDWPVDVHPLRKDFIVPPVTEKES